MPIFYDVDNVSEIIFEHWTGRVTAQEMAKHWGKLLTDGAAVSVCRVLVDLTEADRGFNEAEFWMAVDDHFRENLGHRPWWVAILVANAAQLEASRNWRHLTAQAVTTAIFSDAAKAMHWLERCPSHG